jgi:hypothetical protein
LSSSTNIYFGFFPCSGIPYKDPEKFQTEQSLAAAITAAQRGGRRGGKQQGNGFKPRGAGRQNQGRRGKQSTGRGGKSSFNNQRGGWQKNHGNKTRGGTTGKRRVGSSAPKE